MTSTSVRRHRATGLVVLLAGLVATGVGYAAVTGSAEAAAPKAADDPDRGRAPALPRGLRLLPRPRRAGRAPTVPALIGVGAAAVDFQVDHRPHAAGRARAARRRARRRSTPEADRGARGVRRLARPRPGDPDRRADSTPTDADLAEGGELFRTNCAQCHNFAGRGGALSDGKYAPTLMKATPARDLRGHAHRPAEHAELPRTPRCREEQKQAIIKYIEHLQDGADPGGLALGSFGPVTEGVFIWTAGLGALLARRGVDRGEGAMSDTHSKDLVEVHGGRAADFPLPRAPPRASPTPTRRPPSAPSARSPIDVRRSRRCCTIGFVVAYVHDPDRQLRSTSGRVGTSSRPTSCSASPSASRSLLIGIGAIQWAKKLMADEEIVDERHPLGSPQEDQDAALADVRAGHRRVRLRRAQDGPPHAHRRARCSSRPAHRVPARHGPAARRRRCAHTIWRKGSRIVVDVTGQPLRPEDLDIGTLVSASPEDLDEVQEEEGNQNARAKASIILVRMSPERDHARQQGENWDYEGILAFSKICTHVGCPIALYEQHTHHLLCPCHQSTFDLADAGKVIFGPAARRMPQLPITVDSEGYLVAQSDFQEPVGPSFWERG